MSFGIISIQLRPIRLAFLVRPGDKAGLLDAIRINTFLWGGVFNPIILDYSHLPSVWERHPHPRSNATGTIAGYLDAYDPDFLVLVGKARRPSFDLQGRSVISSQEILASATEDGAPWIIGTCAPLDGPSFQYLNRPLRSPLFGKWQKISLRRISLRIATIPTPFSCFVGVAKQHDPLVRETRQIGR